MDPLTAPILAATLTALTTTTASEAAKTAWNGLLSLVRRHFGTHSAEDTATTAVTSDDPATATHAAHTILAAATSHPDFAHELSQWHQTTVAITQGVDSTTNLITGAAHVGKAFQGRDNHGTINM